MKQVVDDHRNHDSVIDPIEGGEPTGKRIELLRREQGGGEEKPALHLDPQIDGE